MWVAGLVGLHTDRFRNVTLSLKDIQGLRVQDSTCSYTGDGQLLRLGLQASALGIAYEFDPYFWKLQPLANRYPRLSTDRETAEKNSLEWVTPGHPLFEALRRHTLTQAQEEFSTGACFYSLVLVFPHPDRDTPEVQNLRSDPETEAIAMQVVIAHEQAQGPWLPMSMRRTWGTISLASTVIQAIFASSRSKGSGLKWGRSA
jgi:hypothetical protein